MKLKEMFKKLENHNEISDVIDHHHLLLDVSLSGVWVKAESYKEFKKKMDDEGFRPQFVDAVLNTELTFGEEVWGKFEREGKTIDFFIRVDVVY